LRGIPSTAFPAANGEHEGQEQEGEDTAAGLLNGNLREEQMVVNKELRAI
jgi:hypothetical protein